MLLLETKVFTEMRCDSLWITVLYEEVFIHLQRKVTHFEMLVYFLTTDRKYPQLIMQTGTDADMI